MASRSQFMQQQREPNGSAASGFLGGARTLAWPIGLVLGLWILTFSAAHTQGALEWQAGAGYRRAMLAVPTTGRAGFTELRPHLTGVTFTNYLTRTNAALNQILLNGSGVAAGDVDGDGWCDLYFCRLQGPNLLFRNLGNWTFAAVDPTGGIDCPEQYSTGAVLADLDADGDLDLLVNAVGGGTRCFVNDGHGRFSENLNAGLVRQFGSTSLALADIDGDGDLDLYVANYRTTTIRSTGFEVLNVNGQRMLRPEDQDRLYVTPDGFLREHGEVDILYLNDGKGKFQQVSWTDGRFKDPQGKPLATSPRDWALSAMFRDLNDDGSPDLYVCNDFWSPDKIWLNDGHGHFQEIAREALANTSTFSMCMDVADINRDGYDDFLVLDMRSPDHVRRFTQMVMFGLAPWPLGYSAERPQVTRNTLFLNRGDSTYAEIAQMSGVHATDWSWCPIFLDVDLDGYEDLLVATGNAFDTQDQDAEERIKARGPWPREKVPFKLWMYPTLRLPKMAFRNRANLTFEDVGQAWGFNSVGVAQGMCLADLDNDGDLDVIVNHLNAAAGLYRNESAQARLAVRLRGSGGNPRGIGAKIRVYNGPVPMQSQEMICGGRYLSGDDTLRVFAAGEPAARNLRVEVRWRNGKRSIITDAQPNCICEIHEDRSTHPAAPNPPTPKPTPFFVDASDAIQHAHHQEGFDDFTRQPLLPNKLSQSGPGLAWQDLDDDGWEDLVIGGGRGGAMAIYLNNRRGGFTPPSKPPSPPLLARSQTTILGWRMNPETTVLLAGSSNYEDGSPEGASVLAYDRAGRPLPDAFPGHPSSTGPLALADLDGDGDLDLFVGGRVVPSRYPEPASSRLFRCQDGQFKWDRENSRLLENVGLVSAAVFSDLDNDGDPDLVLACEWGPIRLYRNAAGQLSLWDIPVAWPTSPPASQSSLKPSPLTNHHASLTTQNSSLTTPNSPLTTTNFTSIRLSSLTGWWNGVVTGDFDSDGRLDVAASNWGRNSQYQPHRAQPLRLFYGDLNDAGQVDLVEAHVDAVLGKLVPEQGFANLANALPFLRERFTTHKAYAEASLAEILGDRMKAARECAADILESVLFLNRGDHWEARMLPVEAQMSPAFGLCVGDLDGDGAEDLFLSQNFFATQPLTSPYDAGRGLWLKGDGRGGLKPVPGQESGVKVHGEQRGCALADYDHDGRIDLVVAQNSGPTKLYRNQGAQPGLRVRLKGGPANPSGIGAVIRLVQNHRAGPAREIHAGAGYWSQDAPIQVMTASAPPSAVQVRWTGPATNTTTHAVPAGAREIGVEPSGKTEVVQ